MSDIPGVSEVAAQVKETIEEFKPHIPLIQGLRNPGMRARHWEQLSNELGAFCRIRFLSFWKYGPMDKDKNDLLTID